MGSPVPTISTPSTLSQNQQIMPASFEPYDDDAWDHGIEIFEAWKATLFNETVYRAVAKTVLEHTAGERALEICAPQKGAFNVYFRLRFASRRGAIMRFPIPAYFQYAEEKITSEAATMRYILDHTSIPIPFVSTTVPKRKVHVDLGLLWLWSGLITTATWSTLSIPQA